MIEPVSESNNSFKIKHSDNDQPLSPESFAACLVIERAYAATDPGVPEALAILSSNKIVGPFAQKCLTEIEQGKNGNFMGIQLMIGFAAGAIENGKHQPDQMAMSQDQAKQVFSALNENLKLEGHGLIAYIYDLLQDYLHGKRSIQEVTTLIQQGISNM